MKEEDPSEYKIMNEAMGGELAEIIRKTKNDEFYCDECDGIHQCVNWRSRDILGTDIDTEGFADKTGKKWWIYIYCKKGIYQWAYWKIQNRLVKK